MKTQRQLAFSMALTTVNETLHIVAIGMPERHVQSFALWQQATTEIMRRNHSVIACSRHIYVMLFFAYIPFVVNRAFQRNASGVVATIYMIGKD